MAHSVSLTWVASTDSSVAGFQGYNIYKGAASGQETTLVNTAGVVTGTSFTDTAATLGESFYVAKSVANGVVSSASNEVLVSILPAPPTDLVAVAS